MGGGEGPRFPGRLPPTSAPGSLPTLPSLAIVHTGPSYLFSVALGSAHSRFPDKVLPDGKHLTLQPLALGALSSVAPVMSYLTDTRVRVMLSSYSSRGQDVCPATWSPEGTLDPGVWGRSKDK